MLVLGLGTNLGDQLEHLRRTVKRLQQIDQLTVLKISPVYQSDALLPDKAPSDWNKSYLNLAVACTTILSPQQLLSEIKKIETEMGRKQSERWAPRVIDIDILVWDDLVLEQDNLHIPHRGLCERPFALLPLLDVLPNWQHLQNNIASILQGWHEQMPFQTKKISQRVDTSSLMGILNITADSFSDGGQFNTVETALAQVEKLFAEGAEVIDIGAESTRPGAILVTPEKEWQILQPILQAIKKHWQQNFRPKISIDTRHYQTAEQVINLGVDWINDVSGFVDSKMCAVVANANVKCVVMHNLGVPADKTITLPDDLDVCEQVLQWARQRIDKIMTQGVCMEKIIFDVGIGFGKSAQQDLFLLKNISRFSEIGFPLLVGHSRKSFMRLLDLFVPQQRDYATSIISYHLAKQKIDYLRVHNVAANVQALKIVAEMGVQVF